MSTDYFTTPGQAFAARLRRHPFVLLSLGLHAGLIAVLAYTGYTTQARIESDRQQRAVASGQRLTERARLEKRVHDMERIKSLLEESAAAHDAKGDGGAPESEADDVLFSEQPRAPEELLKEARELAREIDDIARETKAERLAELLDIPKEEALKRVEEPPQPPDVPGAPEVPDVPDVPEQQAASAPSEPPAPPDAAPVTPAEAAAQIEQLEAKARQALEQRRQQLEQRQSGVQVSGSGAGGPQAGSMQASNMQAGSGLARGAGQGGQDGRQGHGNGIANGAADTSLLARIAGFTNPELPDRATQAYKAGGIGRIFDPGAGRMPVADTAGMVKGKGRSIGPGGAYANRVYVNRWYLIGPFAGRHGAGLFANPAYPPEQGVVLDAVYRGKNDRLLKWEYVDMARYPMKPPVQAEDAVYYGYTELMMDEERDLTIWVGADDDAQLWLNDKVVWKGGNVSKQWFFEQIYQTNYPGVRDYNLSEGKRTVRFRKGRNKLFFKLSNGPTRVFFSLVLTK